MINALNPEIVSLVALVIALASTIINYLVLRLQRDPEVVVYALPDTSRPSIINLVIENVGKGVAHDIKFEPSRQIPHRAFGFEPAPLPEPMIDGPLICGIPSMVPGEKRIITWGQFGGLRKGLGDEVLDIMATYRSLPALRLTSQKHKTSSRIDIKSFEGTDASDQNWDKKIANQLEKIAIVLTDFTEQTKQFKGYIERRDK